MTPPGDSRYHSRIINSIQNSREGSICELKDDAIDEQATEEYDSELSQNHETKTPDRQFALKISAPRTLENRSPIKPDFQFDTQIPISSRPADTQN